MKAVRYSLEDLSCAQVILTDHRGLYDHHFEVWAAKVINWFKNLYYIARMFHKHWLNDWQMSLKGVWQCVRKGMNLSKLALRVRRMVYQLGHQTYEPIYIEAIRWRDKYSQKTRAAKSRRLMRCAAITERLQTAVNLA